MIISERQIQTKQRIKDRRGKVKREGIEEQRKIDWGGNSAAGIEDSRVERKQESGYQRREDGNQICAKGGKRSRDDRDGIPGFSEGIEQRLMNRHIKHNMWFQPLEGSGTRHSLSFWSLRLGREKMGYGQTAGPKNTGKVKNTRLAPFSVK